MDEKILDGLANASTPNAEEYIVQRDRVGRVGTVLAEGADLEQARLTSFPSIEDGLPALLYQ